MEAFLALKRFGKKIRDHIVGGAIFNMKVTLFDSVGDKKIPDIQMFSSLGTGSSSVVLEENFRLIVLVHDCRIDNISLAFQEIIRPAEMSHQIISCNEFSVC